MSYLISKQMILRVFLFSYSLDKSFHLSQFQANLFSREMEWKVFTETAS